MRYDKQILTSQQKKAKYWIVEEDNFAWLVERRVRSGQIRTIFIRIGALPWSDATTDESWSVTRFRPHLRQYITKSYTNLNELIADKFELFL